MSKRILVICPYPVDVAPAQRLKYEQYFDHFRKAGYEIDVEPFISIGFWDIIYEKGNILKKIYWTASGYLKRILLIPKIAKYDIVYNFLWVTPFGKPIFEWIVVQLSKKLIYDIDDMVFLGHSSAANRKLQFIKGKSKMMYLMKKADHVITCTPVLNDMARKYNQNTTDISSTIDTDSYTPKRDISFGTPLCIGWSGSHSTSKYLRLLEPVFLELHKRGLDFKVLVIGDKNFTFESNDIPLEAIEWKRETEVEDLKRIDIGVYPLPDEPWVYGKSGLKALQYMSLGIPTIASDVGTIKRIIVPNKNGFLASISQEWVDIILKLNSNSETIGNISDAAIQTVELKYSVKANIKTYLSILATPHQEN